MSVNIILLNANPFFEAYGHSDAFGRLIFLSLYFLSICSWAILIYKLWIIHQAKRNSFRFYEAFLLHKSSPLSLDCDILQKERSINPFLDLYTVLKNKSFEIFAKNRMLQQTQKGESKNEIDKSENLFSSSKATSRLSLGDIDYLSSHLATQVASQVKYLEKYLYVLSTTVSLAPFLGLLGTIWGILITFSELQTQSATGTHQMVLGGLSLALAATVLGLLNAIPALIGYNYLKNSVRDFSVEMEGFANDILTSVELQYAYTN